jgi:hypothetical protein
MANRLLEKIEYKIERTGFGTWRRYGYDNGMSYHEFTSHKAWGGLPLVHFTCGRNPETGRRKVARGVVAVGRVAVGIVAVGQASMGAIAIGQLAIGFVLGLGQLATGLGAVGQAAVAVYFGLGQFAAGYIAIGQFAVGKYVLAQLGAGEFVLSMNRADQQAIEFFKSLPIIKTFMP